MKLSPPNFLSLGIASSLLWHGALYFFFLERTWRYPTSVRLLPIEVSRMVPSAKARSANPPPAENGSSPTGEHSHVSAPQVRVPLDFAGLNNPFPAYPEEALEDGLEGVVVVEIKFVSRKPDVRLLRSSGYSLLDENVLATLSRWKFPEDFITQAGENSFELPFQFRLKDFNAENGERR